MTKGSLLKAAVGAGLVGLGFSALAGCGGSSPPSAGGASGTAQRATVGPTKATVASADLDACKVLDAQQVGAIMGTRYTGKPSTSGGGSSMCSYVAVDQSGSFFTILTEPPALMTWAEAKSTVLEDNGVAKPVAKLGDAAVFGVNELAVQSGDRYIDVHMIQDPSSGDTHPVALARAILASWK